MTTFARFGQESAQFSQTVLQSRQREPSQQASFDIFKMPFFAIACALEGYAVSGIS